MDFGEQKIQSALKFLVLHRAWLNAAVVPKRILDFSSIQKEKKGKREKYSGKKNENGSEIFC